MKNDLENLREQIDVIDEQIVILLVKRMAVIKKVGRLKKKMNIPVFDKSRWQKIIRSKKGFVQKIWKIIHEEALKIEKSV